MKEKLELLVSIFGEYQKESQTQYLFFCPFCDHHKPKLSINPEKLAFKCWICGKSGSLDYLIKRKANYEQRKRWSEITGRVDFSLIDSLERKMLFGGEEKKKVDVSLPPEFLSLTNPDIRSLAQPYFSYLESRGIGPKEILRWRIGFCPEGKYKERVIFPSAGLGGKVNYFVGRNIHKYGSHYLAPDVPRDSIIFNELDIDWDSPITLVEGVFDAVKAGENSIPLLDSYLSENSYLFRCIAEKCPKVYVSLDQDAREKERDLIALLMRHDIEVYKIFCPVRDPGELGIGQFLDLKTSAQRMTSSSILISSFEEI
jgi:hypothetical protein